MGVKYMTLNQKRLKLAIWDTAGQERFRTLTSSYYRGAQGIILVYDHTVPASFENLRYWLDEVRKYSTQADAIKMLVANKVDKESDGRKVTREEGEEFAISNSMLFIETSAKTKQGVKQAFEEVVLKILDSRAWSPRIRPAGRGSLGGTPQMPRAVPAEAAPAGCSARHATSLCFRLFDAGRLFLAQQSFFFSPYW